MCPKVVYIDNSDEGNVALKPCPGEYAKPLWFPKKIVFEYDEALIKELTNAFESGNINKLREIWGKAKPLN